jgi:predicted hotdog family 3-hydroxylacyl-ACP dehydratase
MALKPCAHALAELLPHAPPMILIDEVLGWDDGRIVTALTVRSGAPFVVAGRGAPAHVALEWMAQSCGALAGIAARARGYAPRVGFILGTRDFDCSCAWFAEGERLEIDAARESDDGEAGLYRCAVRRGAQIVATAHIAVHVPRA